MIAKKQAIAKKGGARTSRAPSKSPSASCLFLLKNILKNSVGINKFYRQVIEVGGKIVLIKHVQSCFKNSGEKYINKKQSYYEVNLD